MSNNSNIIPFEYKSTLENFKPYDNPHTEFMSTLTDEQLAEAGLEILNWKRGGFLVPDSIVKYLNDWIVEVKNIQRNFTYRDVEDYVVDEIVKRFSNRVLDSTTYANLDVGSKVWYFDPDCNDPPEEGTIARITYELGKIDSICIEFKDDADEFYIEDVWNKYVFGSREEIKNRFGV